ncbi:ketopantoate reductase family protein [Euzebya tangerina]|uniref:ketopantoate reductase family protein n=1 Tax=Euzebya tangerina TaxID=591198 RepID=UPI000E30BBF3|nr:2-dehydropantoate 2-reductase N-terminal domain-containing protein [Euzebya tangerina]
MSGLRFLVVGPGAIGGTLAAQLQRTGQEVEVVARGPHLERIRASGLTVRAPDGAYTAPLRAHDRISEATITSDTVVAVATKVHQSEPVLDELLAHAGPDVAVACVQNGVEGERMALRRFRHVYAVLVNTPGVHLEPGVVEVYADAPRGVLDVGRYPRGVDARAEAIARAWTRAEFISEATPHLIARKWSKLIGNTGNALQVLCGNDRSAYDEIAQVVMAESRAVAEAAGISVHTEDQQRRARMVNRKDIDDVRRPGGSTWQSAVRGTGDVETVALNGEICLLGRLHRIPTPANDLIQSETVALIADGRPVGSVSQEELLARLAGGHRSERGLGPDFEPWT